MFDCLAYEVLFIRKLEPTLKVQSTQSVLKYICNVILHSLLFIFIVVINTRRIHYPNIYLDNGVMKTPKERYRYFLRLYVTELVSKISTSIVGF